MMSEVTCPHCNCQNVAGTNFCQFCGKAVPGIDSGSPQIIESASNEFASTSSGMHIQMQELKKTAGKSFKALLAIGVIQILVGVILFFAMDAALRSEGILSEEQIQGAKMGVLLIMSITGVIFLALAFWARKSPLPASIAGLLLYVTLLGADAVFDPSSLLRGWLIKIIIILVLSKAIKAGLKYSNLKKAADIT